MFSLILILGIIFPSSSTATNLYTPSKTGLLLAVINRSPHQKHLLERLELINPRIIYSSSEVEAMILQSG